MEVKCVWVGVKCVGLGLNVFGWVLNEFYKLCRIGIGVVILWMY